MDVSVGGKWGTWEMGVDLLVVNGGLKSARLEDSAKAKHRRDGQENVC